MAELPGHKKRLYERKWIADAVTSIAALAAALYAAYAASKNEAVRAAVPWLVASAVALALGLVGKSYLHGARKRSRAPKGLSLRRYAFCKSQWRAVWALTRQNAMRCASHSIVL